MSLRVLITRRLPKEGTAMLKARKDLTVTVHNKDTVMPRKELLKKVRGCTAILSLLTDKIDAELLDAAGPQLTVVANYAVGFDNIDLKECAKRGITVCNTPGVLNNAVAEHAVALMLSIARRIPEADAFFRKGKYKGWEPLMLLGSGIQGKTLGVIGLGRIGKGVVDRCMRGLGMKIMYYDVHRDPAFEMEEPTIRYASIEEILREADVVSVHVPLLPTTRHLISAKQLRMMKKTAYLVNTSRGPIIDEKALVSALRAKRIAGAALDVFEFEPKPAPGLTALKNVILTPHIASATVEARIDMATLAAQGVLDVIDGKVPANKVNVA